MKLKGRKNFINFVLLIALLFSAFIVLTPIPNPKAFALNWSDYANDTSFVNTGNGTTSRPYKISTAEQLATVARNISNYKSSCFELVNDIDVSKYNWLPIGTPSNPYSGSFDGNGFKITGIKIELSDTVKNSNSTSFYAGLFGYVSSGTITGLRILGNNSINIGVANGILYVGGIAGHFVGTIQDCLVEKFEIIAKSNNTCYAGGILGRVEYGATVNQVFNYANVFAYSKEANVYTGGIAGNSLTNISNAINKGKIQAVSNNANGYCYAGGIAGSCSYTITNAYNTGEIKSGSKSSTTINNVSVVRNFVSYAGGIVGNGATIKNAFNTAKIECSARIIKIYATYNPTQNKFEEILRYTHTVTGGGYSVTSFYNFYAYNYDKSLTITIDGKDAPDPTKDISVERYYEDEKAYAGGIAGYATTVEYAYNTGEIVGGLKVCYETNAFSFFERLRTLGDTGTMTEGTFGILVYYTTIKYTSEINYSAITGNRRSNLTKTYGNNNYFNYEKSLNVIPYENGVTKKSSSSSSSTTTGTIQVSPSYQKYYLSGSSSDNIRNVVLKLNQTSSSLKLSIDFELYFNISTADTKKKGWESRTYDLVSKSVEHVTNYTIKSKENIKQSDLSSDWQQNSNINNGLPTIKGLYW